MTVTKIGSPVLMFGDWPFGPRICFDKEGSGGGGEGTPSGGAEGAAGAEGGTPASDTEGGTPKAPSAGGEVPTATSWRDSITDPDLRKQAERFGSQEDAIRAVVDMRKKLSTAIVLPGKDASEDDIAAYRKRIGVPESPDKYDMPVPEGYEPTEEDKAFRGAVSQKFHELGINAEQAKGISTWWNEFNAKAAEAEKTANETYAKQQQEMLQKKWPGDEFAKNTDYGKRGLKAFAEKAGVNVDDLLQIKTADGRYLLDNEQMVQVFAAIGRESGEDTIGISESERATVQERIAELRDKRDKAQGAGKNDEAKRIDQQLMELYRKTEGSTPVIGAGQRQF